MAGSNRSADFYIRELDALRERHCAKVLARAEEQAKQIVKPAFHQARTRAQRVFAEERKLLEKRLHAAEARLRSVQARRRQWHQKNLLQLAYEDLLQRLGERWRDPTQRRQWISALLQSGVQRLPHQGWRLLHPEDWPASEQEAARDYLQRQGIEAPRFQAEARLSAGLRIHCQGVVLDASVEGLAKDRRRIEARMLALLNGSNLGGNHEQGTHPLD